MCKYHQIHRTQPSLAASDVETKQLQRKQAVGHVNESSENEADIVANNIIRMPDFAFGEMVQRKCAHCEEEEKLQRKPLASFIQRKESSAGAVASDTVTNQISSSRGSGSSMDSSTQSFMQNRFGMDFTDVKIHTGHESVQMNRELNAKAFTVGNDIYFNEGQYNPVSTAGKFLLAHELTHTIQQQGRPAIHKKDIPATEVISAEIQDQSIIDDVVKEVHEASDRIGTDEERIFRAVQRLAMDVTSINLANEKYKEKYGKSMEAELRAEMSGSELRFGLELMGIIDKEGSLITKIPETDEEYKKAAQRLDDAIHPGWLGWGTDEETIYSVLLPFNKDSEKLKKLKLFYRDITGHALKDDIVGDMSRKELAYALYLINDEIDETAMEFDLMKGKSMQWRSSAFFPCVNSVVTYNGEVMRGGNNEAMPCTTFADWATAAKEGAIPGVAEGTIINCWEVILLAAYNAGAIDWKYIHDIYTSVPACNIPADRATTMSMEDRGKECDSQRFPVWKDKLTSGKLMPYEPGVTGGTKPQRGDIVFFNGLAHVALASGSGSQIFTFWPAPMPKPWQANPNKAVVDIIKLSTIEELHDWWVKENKETPVIEFARPEW